MKECIQKIAKNKKSVYIILAIIILLQFMRLFYVFGWKKGGYHSDEIWSYGLANSYYEPYIYMEDDAKKEIYKNLNEWLPGSVFKEYLTVQENEKFSYDSVWYNQTQDMHPPLFYAILHTICSFFPNTYSRWYAFPINAISFIISMIFLYKLSALMFYSKWKGVLVTGGYGFTIACLGNFLYMRMYGMLTMWGIIFTYLHVKTYYKKSFSLKKEFIPIGIISCLGCLTHHYFMVFAFVFAAVYCFYFLLSKQIKTLIQYAASMLIGTGASFLIFPGTIYHMFGRATHSNTWNLIWLNTRYCIKYIGEELLGVALPILKIKYTMAILEGILFLIVMLAVSILFINRREEWAKKAIKNIIESPKKIVNWTKEKKNNINIVVLNIILVPIVIVLFTGYQAQVLFMANYTNRYLFIVYPLIYICIWKCMERIIKYVSEKIKRIKQKKKIRHIALFLSMILLTGWLNIYDDNIYIFRLGAIEEWTNKLADANVVFIVDNPWIVTRYANNFINSDHIYIVTSEKFLSDTENVMKEIRSISSENSMYLYYHNIELASAENPEKYLQNNNTEDLKKVLKSFTDLSENGNIELKEVEYQEVNIFKVR